MSTNILERAQKFAKAVKVEIKHTTLSDVIQELTSLLNVDKQEDKAGGIDKAIESLTAIKKELFEGTTPIPGNVSPVAGLSSDSPSSLVNAVAEPSVVATNVPVVETQTSTNGIATNSLNQPGSNPTAQAGEPLTIHTVTSSSNSGFVTDGSVGKSEVSKSQKKDLAFGYDPGE
jgi:hypothetical protein